ncbi:hypothetical protein AK812_SmicGene37108 [Symbiodinium microadriaticum]|uniref:Uncharacterized protein n=1 Tax=Symbiodinium microadriaticum TaxID=2951 RepID=A0A1Q9CH56_SYMMI|nr:hypothetical protein AK812_SmicGene37108 [Symbiodinium microadriaticum]
MLAEILLLMRIHLVSTAASVELERAPVHRLLSTTVTANSYQSADHLAPGRTGSGKQTFRAAQRPAMGNIAGCCRTLMCSLQILAGSSRRTRDECSGAVNQHRFLDAAKAGNFSQVRNMLTESPELINCQPGGRWSALHHAAYKGNLSAVQNLLERPQLTRSRLKLPPVVPQRKFLLLLPCGDSHLIPFPEVSVRAVMAFSATFVLMTSQLERNSGRSLAVIPFTLAASMSGCKRSADAVRRVGETSRIAPGLPEVKTSEASR